MTEQMCQDQRLVTGVTVTCHRTRAHKGPHASSSYGVRWRDSGEVLPPPAAPRRRADQCKDEDCTLWRGHAGAHGHQEALL